MKTNGQHEVIARTAGLGWVLATVLAMVFSGCVAGRAQSSATSPAVPAATPVKAAPAAHAAQPVAPSEQRPGGNHEGVKMHGHWVIDVRNPDGTLAQHRDFENSIQSSGQAVLVGLMSGYYVPGDYAISMQPKTGPSPCNLNSTEICIIVRSLTTSPGYYYCYNSSLPDNSGFDCATGLTYTYNINQNLTSPFSMVLSGSITANQAGSIGSVQTVSTVCYDSTDPPTGLTTISPSACVTNLTTNDYYQLSSAPVSPVMQVTNGQIIQVTVTITFS